MRALNDLVDPPVEDGAPAEIGARPRSSRADLWSFASYAVLSLVVMLQLWRDPNGRALLANRDDHGFFMVMMAHGERVIFHGANPLFSDRFNVPDGVSIIGNTSVLLLSLPMAPVTHFLGAGVSVVLLLTLGLAGTAAAWYWVLSRHFVRGRVAAWIGGLWCGFCPAMISHAAGHVNFVSGWLVPFIVLQLFRLREPGRVRRGGVALGLLVTAQIFLNEEVLLFTALTLGVFLIAYVAMNRRRAMSEARHLLPGVLVAGLVAGVLLAYPLWYQFTGPGSYHGQPFVPDKYVTDLAALGVFARQSLAGYTALTRKLSVSPTEDDTFFGPFGLLMIVVSAVVVWRSVAARAAAIAGAVIMVAALGTHLKVFGHVTGVWMPFDLVKNLPVINLVSVSRFAMAPAVVAGVLIALATDRISLRPGRARTLFRVGLVLALVPLTPKPLPIVGADPLPPFIAQGTWKQYVPAGRTLVPMPLPEVTSGRQAMRWLALTDLAFTAPRGYFMGPADPPGDLTGSWTGPPRYTSTIVRTAVLYGMVPRIGPQQAAAIRQDLIYWRAAVVVLVPGQQHGDIVESIVREALGSPQVVGGVEIWDVRSLPVPPHG